VSFFFRDPVPSRTWLFDTDNKEIELSIVLPVFNQDQIITRVLENLASSISLCSELIIINDGSEDETQLIILNFFDNLGREKFPNLVKVNLYSLKFSRFETYCDDFGIRMSQSKYCLEVQADMFISDVGFDKRMLAFMQAFPDIVVLSGRGVEPLEQIIHSYRSSLGTESAFFPSEFHFLFHRSVLWSKNVVKKRIKNFFRSSTENSAVIQGETILFEVQSDQSFLITGRAGRLGNLIDLSPKLSDTLPPRVYLGETVMRGPLLIDKEKYLEIGGFNTGLYFLGYDDHDFCQRANSLQFRVGYIPVYFSSPLHLGATRKHRTALSEFLIFLNILRIRKHRSKSALWAHGHEKKLNCAPPEIRYLA